MDAASLPERGDPPASLLDLLVQQRGTEGAGSGIRLTFSQELTQEIKLLGKDAKPFHFAAMKGDVTLVLALHVARVPMDSPVPLARFSSGGPMGTTPWEKDVCVMPSETAAVAGHTRCSEILRLVEAGVPFFWSEAAHASTPAEFQAKIRSTVDALCRTRWFLDLPGPARLRVLEYHCASRLNEAVWSAVTDSEREQVRRVLDSLRPGASVLDLENALSGSGGRDAPAATTRSYLDLPQYNFRLVQRPPPRLHWIRQLFGHVALRTMTGLFAAASVSKPRQGGRGAAHFGDERAIRMTAAAVGFLNPAAGIVATVVGAFSPRLASGILFSSLHHAIGHMIVLG